jgi:IS30 family transposase
LTTPLRRKTEAKLRQMRWSPGQIRGLAMRTGVKLSHEQFYQMIWQDKRDGGDLWRSLRRREKRYNERGGKKARRGVILDCIDISERPTNPSGRLGGRYLCQCRTHGRLANAGRAQNLIGQNH